MSTIQKRNMTIHALRMEKELHLDMISNLTEYNNILQERLSQAYKDIAQRNKTIHALREEKR